MAEKYAVVEIKDIKQVRKVADLGKPGTPTHAVEFEFRVSRRNVFRVVVPFVASLFMINDKIAGNERNGY